MAGGKSFELNNSVYLAEKENSFINEALMNLMQATKAFPEKTNLEETL